jgi:AraC-like DNA-binding protein
MPRKGERAELDDRLRSKGFRVDEFGLESHVPDSYKRKGYYKICLIQGEGIVHYTDRSMEVSGATLFFGNPHIPYAWAARSGGLTGYTCQFLAEYLKGFERPEGLQESSLFKIGGTPIFSLNDEQRDSVAAIFRRMIAEQGSDYVFKDDLIRNYINLIMHEALKMQPADQFFKSRSALSRISAVFLELLERQFPANDPWDPLILRSPHEFARYLCIHVNYLNRAVKTITGKTTTEIIADRIIVEAKALLQKTTMPIGDISSALGFESPTYFNNFFKRMTGHPPTAFRSGKV